jgi:hypothetical protein
MRIMHLTKASSLDIRQPTKFVLSYPVYSQSVILSLRSHLNLTTFPYPMPRTALCALLLTEWPAAVSPVASTAACSSPAPHPRAAHYEQTVRNCEIPAVGWVESQGQARM